MKESFKPNKQQLPDKMKLATADQDGTEVMEEWEVSHSSGDMVYLKHRYDSGDDARFVYRGMSRARYNELTGDAFSGGASSEANTQSANNASNENGKNKESLTLEPFTVPEARVLLTYADIGEEGDPDWMSDPEALELTNELIELSHKYGRQEVMKLSQAVRKEYQSYRDRLNFTPGENSVESSISWSMEAIARQSYAANNPGRIPEITKPGNPFDRKNRKLKIHEMSSEHLGWEFQTAMASAGKNAVNVLPEEEWATENGNRARVRGQDEFIDKVVDEKATNELIKQLIGANKGGLTIDVMISLGEVLKSSVRDSKKRENLAHTELPEMFEEMRHLKGHSIEDLLDKVGDIQGAGKWYGTAIDAYIEHMRDNTSMKDARFVANIDNIVNYDAELREFTLKHHNENIYADRRKAVHDHVLWVQHDSKAFIKSRVEGRTTDVADSRFYLNPPLKNMIPIYKEIYERAESEGLRFRAKVFDFDLRRGERKTSALQRERAKMWSDKPRLRNDPMVFYGFHESKQRLYEIIKEVYEEHEEVFQGRELGFAPYEIAPGFGVGEEPIEPTGKESLSSFLKSLLSRVSTDGSWNKGKDPESRKRIFAESFREMIKKNNYPVNPDNIAFR